MPPRHPGWSVIDHDPGLWSPRYVPLTHRGKLWRWFRDVILWGLLDLDQDGGRGDL